MFFFINLIIFTMKTKDHTIHFILNNIKMNEKRVQRVMTDIIRYFDDTVYGENPVIELLTGAPFKEITAFNAEVLKANAKNVTYYDDVDENSIQITGVNNVGKCLYISWRRESDDSTYNTNVLFDSYNRYAKEYNARLNDDDADDATK